jgi:KipI family sensor histidine kinase inhibitor
VLVRARGQLEDIIKSVQQESWNSTGAVVVPGQERRIAVRYDGPDLLEVSERLGMSPSKLVELHTGAAHIVQHFGFSPGFPYLAGSSQALDVPRRPTPRESVAAGSVAIAGGATVIYPGGTPGGWNIIGHADAPTFWDLDRDPPNTFSLGDRVVFESRG